MCDCLQVYGETSYELVKRMIDTLEINEDDVFIDLGSGKIFYFNAIYVHVSELHKHNFKHFQAFCDS